MQAEADTLAKLCSVESMKEAFTNAFSEELDVVTFVHGDLWSSNMMFRVTLRAPDDTSTWCCRIWTLATS